MVNLWQLVYFPRMSSPQMSALYSEKDPEEQAQMSDNPSQQTVAEFARWPELMDNPCLLGQVTGAPSIATFGDVPLPLNQQQDERIESTHQQLPYFRCSTQNVRNCKVISSYNVPSLLPMTRREQRKPTPRTSREQRRSETWRTERRRERRIALPHNVSFPFLNSTLL